MASKYLRKFRVPEDFKDVLIELIRNVLKGKLLKFLLFSSTLYRLAKRY